jgi:hypothetical protein
MGCHTFLYDLPGVEVMEPLVSMKLARIIRKPEEINLEKNNHSFSDFSNEVFEHDWQKKWDEFSTLNLSCRIRE